ncbi:helix-turn-helix domain-containing protein [Roseobacter litoralis]|uniref:helix-turn-helix domain-containing protein n=1 Tax=Roseobacter litoralis TaxID=42443 RepID=UPI003CD0DC48
MEPRGQAHKGYSGGGIFPPLHAKETIPERVATEIGREIGSRYEAGASIRDLAVETGYPIQRVRSLLELAETPLRKRGRPAAE